MDKTIMGTDFLSRNRCANARKKLIAKGLLETLSVQGTGISGQSQCDIVENVKSHRGGMLHSFWIFRIAEYFRKQGYSVNTGDTSTQHEIDLTAISSNQKIAIEIVISSLVKDNVDKYKSYFDRVLILAVDDKKLKEIVSLFEIDMKIEFGLLKEYFIGL